MPASSPNICGNIIFGNNATNKGGGLSIHIFSSAIISGNSITGNSASYGGGLRVGNSSPIISNNIISSNSANNGGGLYLEECTPAITGGEISYNAEYGIFKILVNNPTITEVAMFSNNPSNKNW